MRSIEIHCLWLPITLFLALAFSVSARRDPNEDHRLKTRIWLPQEPGPNIIGIFPCDEGNEKAAMKKAEEDLRDLDNLEADGLHLDDDAGVDGADSDYAKVPDITATPRPARVRKPFVWVTTGRHGGALELKGGKAVLMTARYSGIGAVTRIENAVLGGTFTVDAWFCPKQLGGTLIWLGDGFRRQQAFAVILTRDGAVEVWLGAKKLGVAEGKLAVGRWTHVSLSGFPARGLPGRFTFSSIKVPPQLEVRLDGRLAGAFSDDQVPAYIKQLEGIIYFGNDNRGAQPFVGCLDDVRVCDQAQEYFANEVAWTDPEAKRELTEGQPALRDVKDILLAASLDRDPATVTGAARFRSSSYPDGKTVRHWPGVRGPALMLGSDLANPVYTATAPLPAELGSVEFWFMPHDWDNGKVYVGYLHLPAEYVPILGIFTHDPAKPDQQQPFLGFALNVMGPEGGEPALSLVPGTWYHVVITWEGGRHQLYVNGQPQNGYLATLTLKPAPGQMLSRVVLGNGNGQGLRYHGVHTLVDELRLYSRPLTPLEVTNADARFRPDGKVQPLPFSDVKLDLNLPLQRAWTAIELLSPKRDQVAGVDMRLFREDVKLAEHLQQPVANGRCELTMKPVDIGFGPHRLELTYRDQAGAEIDRQTVSRSRPQPAWYHSGLGLHPNEVLPGWTPMAVAGATVKCWGREYTFNGGNWPVQLRSQDADLLAKPVQVLLTTAAGQVLLKPAQDLLKVVKSQQDLVITQGVLSGGGWQLATQVTTEFDGMMKYELTLTPPAAAEIKEFRIELPLVSARALFVGFSGGENWFRGSCDYRLLPTTNGVIFASHQTGRSHVKQWQGKNSFLPYLTICDDDRGLVWFAENEQHWTKAWDPPAQDIVRAGDVTTLRLNLIRAPTQVDGPLTYVFGLQTTPVRPMIAKRRSLPATANFGWVDSFSKQDLKTDRGHQAMRMAPVGLDWEAAQGRVTQHIACYRGDRGYTKPILYTDRNWEIPPEDASEWAGLFRRGAYRYTPDAQDCFLWCMNEWLRRGYIRGIYIDDAWICQNYSPDVGPAYRLPDGTVQPGFEFFGFREFMKRLRWLFHDNQVEPYIWVHMTQTHFIPFLAFADIILEGEDRFLPPAHPSNFISMWGLPRLRFASPEKWGLATKWMNKIGNEQKPTQPMPHWFFRQERAYRAGLLLNDIQAEPWKDFLEAGCLDDQAEFIGYWDTAKVPLTPETKNCYASVYRLPKQAAVILVNDSKETVIAKFRVDPGKFFTGAAAVTLRDADSEDPPAGEDILTMKKPQITDQQLGEMDGEMGGMLDEIEDDLNKTDEQKEHERIFNDHGFRFQDGLLELKIRPFDYRLLVVSPK